MSEEASHVIVCDLRNRKQTHPLIMIWTLVSSAGGFASGHPLICQLSKCYARLSSSVFGDYAAVLATHKWSHAAHRVPQSLKTPLGFLYGQYLVLCCICRRIYCLQDRPLSVDRRVPLWKCFSRKVWTGLRLKQQQHVFYLENGSEINNRIIFNQKFSACCNCFEANGYLRRWCWPKSIAASCFTPALFNLLPVCVCPPAMTFSRCLTARERPW